jgi:hypothetical protein
LEEVEVTSVVSQENLLNLRSTSRSTSTRRCTSTETPEPPAQEGGGEFEF